MKIKWSSYEKVATDCCERPAGAQRRYITIEASFCQHAAAGRDSRLQASVITNLPLIQSGNHQMNGATFIIAPAKLASTLYTNTIT
jgi:hypothetical protein